MAQTRAYGKELDGGKGIQGQGSKFWRDIQKSHKATEKSRRRSINLTIGIDNESKANKNENDRIDEIINESIEQNIVINIDNDDKNNNMKTNIMDSKTQEERRHSLNPKQKNNK